VRRFRSADESDILRRLDGVSTYTRGAGGGFK